VSQYQLGLLLPPVCILPIILLYYADQFQALMHMILELREDIQRVQGAAAPTPAATPPSSRLNGAVEVSLQ